MNPEITITYTDESGMSVTKVSHSFESAEENLGKIERFVEKQAKARELNF